MKNDRDSKGRFIHGVPHPPIRKNIDLELLKEEYLSGKSTVELGNLFNVSDKTISNRLKEIGVKLRTKKEASKIINGSNKTQFEKGYNPWHYGTKGLGVQKKTTGSFKKGHKTWNKGLEGVQISSKKGKNFEEFYGNERAKLIRSKIKEKRKTQVTPLKDTKIEVKLQNYLKQLGVEFCTHQYMNIEHGYQCDIMIPEQDKIDKKTIIECFGDYWHNYPYAREIDVMRCNELRKSGWRVLVFWECEIKHMPIEVMEEKLYKC